MKVINWHHQCVVVTRSISFCCCCWLFLCPTLSILGLDIFVICSHFNLNLNTGENVRKIIKISNTKQNIWFIFIFVLPCSFYTKKSLPRTLVSFFVCVCPSKCVCIDGFQVSMFFLLFFVCVCRSKCACIDGFQVSMFLLLLCVCVCVEVNARV